MIVNDQITETTDADDQFLAGKAFAIRVLVRNMENNAFIHTVAIGRHLRDVPLPLPQRQPVLRCWHVPRLANRLRI
jgi:hypothetical protein